MNDESFDFAQTAELHAQCVMKCRLLTHYFTVEVDWLRLLKKNEHENVEKYQLLLFHRVVLPSNCRVAKSARIYLW